MAGHDVVILTHEICRFARGANIEHRAAISAVGVDEKPLAGLVSGFLGFALCLFFGHVLVLLSGDAAGALPRLCASSFSVLPLVAIGR